MAQSSKRFDEELHALMDYFGSRKLSFSTACAVMGVVIAAAAMHSDRKASRSSFRHLAEDLKKRCSELKEPM
jgi:site-specific recombinase